MLMEVKKELKVISLSIKYAIMREALNKVSFITNILFMILNNACFIVQWIILYSVKDNIGGYTLNKVLLLWALAASTYGFAHLFFEKAFSLSDTINNGKLDSYLVQPRNVLLSVVTSDVKISAIGDLIYGLIMIFICGLTIKKFILFVIFTITGGLILVSISIIYNSLSFWFSKSDFIADIMNDLMIHPSTYPEGIFKGLVKIILYTIIPIGLVNYIPINVIVDFKLILLLIVILFTIFIVTLSFIVFNNGLKKYSSSNLMIARL